MARTWWVVLMLLLCGCFDSQWGETKRAQARGAAAANPSQINRVALADEEGKAITVPTHSYRVRAYVSQRYRGQTVDWNHTLRSTIDDGNQVLVPGVGVRLQVVSADPWEPSNEDDLESVLTQLEKEHPADDCDWVVAMVSALPITTSSFHKQGLARVLGKHIVLRGVGVLGERDQIDRAFDQLDESSRARLAKQRMAHRAETVLLHEIGHTLGAIHETSAESLMFHSYDHRMSGYTGRSLSIMTAGVRDRNATSPEEHEEARREMLSRIAADPDGGWVAADRTMLQTLLESRGHVASAPAQRTPATPPPATDPQPSTPAIPPPPKELTPAEQELFTRAWTLGREGKPEEAWTVAKPLFKYETSFAVQDLRCQLASATGVSFNVARKECEPLMKLTMSPDAKK